MGDKAYAITNEFEISRIAGNLGVGPKILDTYTCCSDGGSCYYVLYMELVQGHPLCEWFDLAPSTEAKSKVKQLLDEMMELLHKNGIIHNELHCNNIIVVGKGTKDEDVKIIDYGRAGTMKSKSGRASVDADGLRWVTWDDIVFKTTPD